MLWNAEKVAASRCCLLEHSVGNEPCSLRDLDACDLELQTVSQRFFLGVLGAGWARYCMAAVADLTGRLALSVTKVTFRDESRGNNCDIPSSRELLLLGLHILDSSSSADEDCCVAIMVSNERVW